MRGNLPVVPSPSCEVSWNRSLVVDLACTANIFTVPTVARQRRTTTGFAIEPAHPGAGRQGCRLFCCVRGRLYAQHDPRRDWEAVLLERELPQARRDPSCLAPMGFARGINFSYLFIPPAVEQLLADACLPNPGIRSCACGQGGPSPRSPGVSSPASQPLPGLPPDRLAAKVTLPSGQVPPTASPISSSRSK